MLYLITAVLCNACINLGFTLGKTLKQNNLKITWFNYLTATVVSLVSLLRQGIPAANISLTAMAGNVTGAGTGDGNMTMAVALGILTGVIYLVAFLVIQNSIMRSGPSPTTMFNRLGVILSILMAAFLFGDWPSGLRWVGIFFAMAALAVYNWNGSFKMDWLLGLAFLLGGCAEFTGKLFSAWCTEEFKPLYLVFVFGTALLLCTLILLRQGDKKMAGWKEILIGVGIGVANLSATSFKLKALTVLPANVVFTSMCAGVVLVIAVAGRLFFGEKLGRKGLAAILLTIVSLVLVNI